MKPIEMHPTPCPISIFASCERALHLGFRDVRGIEPSRDAVSQANPSLRRHIIGDVMRPGIFKAGEFDAICMFHVFDHIPIRMSFSRVACGF
jgi:hypothetical protein